MVFAAGLVLIFVGLALVIPGRIPVGSRELTAKSARWAGGVLLAFLPVAVIMHFLWQRFQWGGDMPLVNAQWTAFGLLVCASIGIALYSMFGGAKKPARRPVIAPAFAEEPAMPEAPPEMASPEIAPPPSVGKKQKPKAGGDPFDFA